jgi:uncharacterized SAM-binding protein YcdF (DUF218 family)
MALPAAAGIVFVALGVFNLTKRKPFFKSKIIVRLIAASIALAAIFFFTIEAFIWAGANAKDESDEGANFVVVLGCGIFPDGSLTLTLKNRLDAAYDYMLEYPETICVVSGGQGANEPIPEGQAMAEYLIEKGIDESRVIEENFATSTKENIKYAYKIIDSEYPEKAKTIAISSSDFHMFRVKFLAKRFNMHAIGIPCETPWYIRPNCYIREFFAVIKSFLLDT